MTDLAAWLLTQIETDERVARDRYIASFGVTAPAQVRLIEGTTRWAQIELREQLRKAGLQIVAALPIIGNRWLRALAQPYRDRVDWQKDWAL